MVIGERSLKLLQLSHGGQAPLPFKLLQFSPFFIQMEDTWHLKHLKVKNMPHQIVNYSHLTHFFSNLCSQTIIETCFYAGFEKKRRWNNVGKKRTLPIYTRFQFSLFIKASRFQFHFFSYAFSETKKWKMVMRKEWDLEITKWALWGDEDMREVTRDCQKYSKLLMLELSPESNVFLIRLPRVLVGGFSGIILTANGHPFAKNVGVWEVGLWIKDAERGRQHENKRGLMWHVIDV